MIVAEKWKILNEEKKRRKKDEGNYTQGADNGVVVVDQKDQLWLSVTVHAHGFEDKVANLKAESPKTRVAGKKERKKSMVCLVVLIASFSV